MTKERHNTGFSEHGKLNVSRRSLLLIAGFVWLLASGILISKGTLWVLFETSDQLCRMLGAVVFGILFYRLLFTRISRKHIHRIITLEQENPMFLSFFNARGYVMMGGMITLGMVLRNMDFVNKDLLYTFYIGMGIPLLFSAFRFYGAWTVYSKIRSGQRL